jgi:hypothetical protein
VTQFKGRTEDASAPFLKASFWEKGRSIAGTVIRVFETENGPAAVIRLNSPVMLDGKTEKAVSVGNMAGFRMALDAAGVVGGLLAGDMVYLECSGTTPTDKGNDQVNFEIEVDRPDERHAAGA